MIYVYVINIQHVSAIYVPIYRKVIIGNIIINYKKVTTKTQFYNIPEFSDTLTQFKMVLFKSSVHTKLTII